MSDISPDMKAAREAARNRTGEFGRQERSAPEAQLGTTPSVVEWDGSEQGLEGLRGTDKVRLQCGKCVGTGVYSAPSSITFHTSAVGAVTTGCFDCAGTGFNDYLVSSMRARLRREAKAAEETKAANEAARQRREAWEAAGYEVLFFEVCAALDSVEADDRYAPALRDAYNKLNHYTATAEDAADARAAIQALKEFRERPSALTAGEQVLEGVILSVKWQRGNYGAGSGSVKMLLDIGAARVWGTKPTSLDAADKGDTVRLTATVSPSKDDPEFGFYSRPKKAVLVSKAPEESE